MSHRARADSSVHKQQSRAFFCLINAAWASPLILTWLLTLDLLNASKSKPPFLGATPLMAQFLGLGIGSQGYDGAARWIAKYTFWSLSLFVIEFYTSPSFLLLSLLQALLAFSFVMDAGVNSEYQCQHMHFCCSSYSYLFLTGIATNRVSWRLVCKRRWCFAFVSILVQVGGATALYLFDGHVWDHHAFAYGLGVAVSVFSGPKN